MTIKLFYKHVNDLYFKAIDEKNFKSLSSYSIDSLNKTDDLEDHYEDLEDKKKSEDLVSRQLTPQKTSKSIVSSSSTSLSNGLETSEEGKNDLIEQPDERVKLQLEKSLPLRSEVKEKKEEHMAQIKEIVYNEEEMQLIPDFNNQLFESLEAISEHDEEMFYNLPEFDKTVKYFLFNLIEWVKFYINSIS